jgi:hypothetical protein
VYRDIIVDRKSKYSVVALKITDVKDVKIKFKELISESFFRKATHNSYSYRVVQENGSIIE